MLHFLTFFYNSNKYVSKYYIATSMTTHGRYLNISLQWLYIFSVTLDTIKIARRKILCNNHTSFFVRCTSNSNMGGSLPNNLRKMESASRFHVFKIHVLNLTVPKICKKYLCKHLYSDQRFDTNRIKSFVAKTYQPLVAALPESSLHAPKVAMFSPLPL